MSLRRGLVAGEGSWEAGSALAGKLEGVVLALPGADLEKALTE